MRTSVIAASLLLSASVPALAQNIDALRDGLGHLPATVLMQEHGDVAYFIDVEALNDLAAANSEVRPFFRVMAAADINGLQVLASTPAAEWEPKAGTTLEALRYFTGYGRPPQVVSSWGLADEAAATDMIAALKANGFEDAAPGVVGNGAEMRPDPAKRDPADPWRTRIGAAQFAAASANTVIQAQTPMAAMAAAAEQPRLGDNPIFATALGGLEQSVGQGAVVQAVVISPLFGMMGLDPATLLSPSGDLEDTRKAIEEQMASLEKGIPPYLGGIAADVQDQMQGVTIALTYPDCAIAGQAADTIALRWADMAGEGAQGEVDTGTAEGEDGLCAATFSVRIDTDNPELNPAYRAVIEPHMRGQAGVLQIGES